MDGFEPTFEPVPIPSHPTWLSALTTTHKALLACIIAYLVALATHMAMLVRFYLVKGKYGARLVLDWPPGSPEALALEKGERPLRPKRAFHYILKETAAEGRGKSSDKTPLVVFESHVGLGATCWSYLQDKLDGKLSTLAYQRYGYGWSSDPDWKSPRTTEECATDLHLLLVSLGFVASQPGDDQDKETAAATARQRARAQSRKPSARDAHQRPIIFVGHAFGSAVVQSYMAIYRPANVVGIVMLDPTPVDMFSKYPAIADWTTKRLSGVMRTGSALADLGLLRIASLFGLSMLQMTKPLRERLGVASVYSLREISFDGRSLRTMALEMEGFAASMEQIKRDTDALASTASTAPLGRPLVQDKQQRAAEDAPVVAGVVVTVAKVEQPIVDVGLSPDDWKRQWYVWQREMAGLVNTHPKLKLAISSAAASDSDSDNDDDGGRKKAAAMPTADRPHGVVIMDDQSTSLELCASESVLDALQLLLNVTGSSVQVRPKA